MIHYIAHLLGWNAGEVITKFDSDNNLWVGFQCSGCGKISGKHKTRI